MSAALDVGPVGPKIAPGRIKKAVQLIGDLHEAGVPLVIGTDAGGSPVVPWLVHGPSMEMEVHCWNGQG